MASRLLRLAETMAAGALETGVGALSPCRAAAMGECLLRGLGPLSAVNRRTVGNLGRVFPADRAARLVRDVWGNLGQTLLEYPHLNALHAAGHIELVGADILREAARGNGAVLFSGHLANWECMPFLACEAGVECAVLHRAPSNPRVAEVLARCRPTGAIRYVAKSTEGTRQAFATLAGGGMVGFLIDHRYNRGVGVVFRGGTAMVADTAAVMVRRHRCPLIPIRVERLGRCRYRVQAVAPLPVDHTLPPAEFSRRVMQDAMTLLEGWILERPEQWFWMQRLWT